MHKCFRPFSLVLAAVGSLVFFDIAHAIPAFTRQHKTECSTCHTIYPELNEYGEAFLKNGYVYQGKSPAGEVPPPPAVRGGGDEEQAATSSESTPAKPTPTGRNEGIWLAGIPDILPVSFSASQNVAYNDRAADKLDFSTRALVLQAGGSFRDKAGFFGTFNMFTEGRYDPLVSNVPGNNASNLNELFLVWRHALDTPVNVRIGRLKPKLSLWKSTNKVTITSFAPQVYKVGRSQFTVDSAGDAIEVNGIVGKRLFMAAGIVDRNGQNNKEGYGHVSYKLGGADFLGNEPEIDFERESVWDYLMVTVGAYGYFGRNATVIASVADKSNNFYRAGADLDVLYKRLRGKLSWVKGRDGNPDFLAAASEVKSSALASEVELLVGSQVIAAFRYEYQDDDKGITRRYIPAVAYVPLQNIRLVMEYKHENAAVVTDRIAQLGITFSF